MKSYNNKIIKNCLVLANKIREVQDDLISELLFYESELVAKDEIIRTLKTLANISSELKNKNLKVVSICTFLPLNLPLYSFILFAFVPSQWAEMVYVRPPYLMFEILKRVLEKINLPDLINNIRFLNIERRTFLEYFVKNADVVIFTGKYENAEQVLKRCRNSTLFLYNGTGVNPLLILPNCNIEHAVNKTVEVKTFNSGQDCASPDSILVHKSISSDFLKKLMKKLEEINVGDYKRKQNIVGKLTDRQQLLITAKFICDRQNYIKCGGKIDFQNEIVYPTVLLNKLNEEMNFKELFSPVFYIHEYKDENELKNYFNHTEYLKHAMYISVFGKNKFVNSIKKSIILKEKIILDIEEGNKEYGGYGSNASFVSYNKNYYRQPILISREMYKFLD